MNKIFPWLLAVASLTLVGVPGVSRADTGDGDYVGMQVPDMDQAVRFFHEVMNCDVISANSPDAALLNCGNGLTVELSPAAAASSGQASTSTDGDVTFLTSNTEAAAVWLRSNHVTVLGPIASPGKGPNSNHSVLTFVTPWGQSMQLIGPLLQSDHNIAPNQVATQ